MSSEKRKKGLIEACRAQQQEVIAELQDVIKEAQASANDYGPPKDRYDPYRNQLIRRKNMYSQQLQKALDQEKALDLIDPERSYDKVDFGAVVITDNQRIFIAAPIGKVMYEEKEYFVVSPHVPIYRVMEGKKVGEEYIFNDKKDVIREIY